MARSRTELTSRSHGNSPLRQFQTEAILTGRKLMRYILVISFGLFLSTAIIANQDQAELDPYSVRFVDTTLKARSDGMLIAKSQTHLARMGDGVSIALLKILNSDQLKDPQRMKVLLSIIHDGFSQPQSIKNVTDRKPQVTVFFLSHIRNDIPDPQIRRDIDATITFVERQTSQ